MATITKLEALDNDVIGTIGFSAPVSGGNFFINLLVQTLKKYMTQFVLVM